jgi:hypothetical protein
MNRKRSLDQLLETHLEELGRSGDIETSLLHSPQHADQLRPLLEAAQAVRSYYQTVPEPPEGLAAGRERMLAAAAKQRARQKTAPTAMPPRTRVPRLRLGLASRLVVNLLVVIALTIALGGGMILAAGRSMPGDWLYPVKLAAEDARLVLVRAPASRVDLLLDLVGERTEEIKALVEVGEELPDATVARMEGYIEQALIQIALVDDVEMVALLRKAAERMRTQAQVLSNIQATAPSQAGLARAMAACQQGVEAAEEGIRDPQVFRQRYLHRQSTPEATVELEQATATPGMDQEQRQEQLQPEEQEDLDTPSPMPTRSPRDDPQASPSPQPTPRDPEAHTPQSTPESQPTFAPQTTPTGTRVTAVPQVTPQAHQATPESPAPTAPPQGPGGNPDGGGQDGGKQGEGRE